MAKTFFEACETEDSKSISEAIVGQEFTLVDVDGNQSEEEHNLLVAEVEDFPAIISFSGDEFAQQFTNTVEEALNEDGELPCFVVDGKDFIEMIPENFGVLLNAESEESFIFSPDFVAEIKAHFKA